MSVHFDRRQVRNQPAHRYIPGSMARDNERAFNTRLFENAHVHQTHRYGWMTDRNPTSVGPDTSPERIE